VGKRAARVWFWLTVQLERSVSFRLAFRDLEWDQAVAIARRKGTDKRTGTDKPTGHR